MIRNIHWWLLLILYRSATWLGHQTTIWQKLLRNTLLPYAVKHYRPTWPETAKPVNRWQERLKEAQEAGDPIAPATIEDHYLMTAIAQVVALLEITSTTSDTAKDAQEMKPFTRSCVRYVAFRLRQSVPRETLHSSVPTVDALLRKSKNAKTSMYTNAGTSVVHTDMTRI